MTGQELDLPDGVYTAVVDAIEDGQARAFIEQDHDDITSLTLPSDELPEAGRHADAVFTIVVAQGAIDDWEYDPDATATRCEQAQSRFDRLSKRLSEDS
jgi:hypothetical protein